MVTKSLEEILKLTTIKFESKKQSIFDPNIKVMSSGKFTFTSLIKVPVNISNNFCHTQNTLWASLSICDLEQWYYTPGGTCTQVEDH
jgi:hypothetical protein